MSEHGMDVADPESECTICIVRDTATGEILDVYSVSADGVRTRPAAHPRCSCGKDCGKYGLWT